MPERPAREYVVPRLRDQQVKVVLVDKAALDGMRNADADGRGFVDWGRTPR